MVFPSFRKGDDARLEDVAALGRVAFAAGTAPDVEALMEGAGREVLRAFGADALALYLLPGEGQALQAVYRTGTTPEQAEAFSQVPFRETLAWHVASDGAARSWLAKDYSDTAQAFARGLGFAATSAAALKVQARIIGTLNISFRTPTQLGLDRLHVLEVMAAHFAQAVEAQRATAQARRASEQNAQLYEELRANAAELARARGELAEKARLASLGELSAVIAHELRNPLAVLSNVVSLLVPVDSAAASQELARAAREELSRMNALVSDLLEFARPSELRREPTQVEPLLRDVVQALAVEPGGRLAVEVEVEAALPPVLADPRRLRQALLNLALNGAQAMRGAGRLRLSARRAGAHLRVEIADEGPGIPPDVQARLFQPFFTTKPTGTGLGLALVERVVRQHGGQLALTSEPGRGTTFLVELPLAT